MGNLFDRPFLLDNSGALLSDWKWIIDNGTAVVADNWVVSGDNTIYEVPAGKIFYLSYAWLHIITTGVAALINGSLKVNAHRVLRLYSPGVTGLYDASETALMMPIKLTAGQKVEISSSDNALRASGGCTGFVLDA